MFITVTYILEDLAYGQNHQNMYSIEPISPKNISCPSNVLNWQATYKFSMLYLVGGNGMGWMKLMGSHKGESEDLKKNMSEQNFLWWDLWGK